MNKKDYQSLAAEFAAQRCGVGELGYNEHAEDMRCCLARRVTTVLQADNPSFDRSRFLKACGVEE